jgi:hypothetical protein
VARMLAVSCAAAAAGVLSAQALGEVGLPPVTVSLPTVSLPIPTPPPPPVPAPAPPRIPPAPVPVPAPAVPTPPTAAPPAIPVTPATPTAPAPSTSSPAASLPAGSADSVGSPESFGSYLSSAQTTSTSPSRPARVTRLRASSRRVRTNGRRRTVARITFTLSAPARVRFVVRGPAPSCAVVARFAVRGRAGPNRLRFTGRIGRRQLEPGTYRISARTRAGATARPILVVVGSGPVERPVCSSGAPGGAAPAVFDQLAVAFEVGAPAAQPSTRRDDKKSGGVLPAIRKRIQELPEALPSVKPPVGGVSDPAGLPTWLLGLLLPLAALGGLALIVYVVRYIRRLSVYY